MSFFQVKTHHNDTLLCSRVQLITCLLPSSLHFSFPQFYAFIIQYTATRTYVHRIKMGINPKMVVFGQLVATSIATRSCQQSFPYQIDQCIPKKGSQPTNIIIAEWELEKRRSISSAVTTAYLRLSRVYHSIMATALFLPPSIFLFFLPKCIHLETKRAFVGNEKQRLYTTNFSEFNFGKFL